MIPGLPVPGSVFRLLKDGDASLPLPDLKPGQTINAKVLDLVSPGRAQLLLAGRKVTVQTDLQLKPGMDIMLDVTREKDSILLKPAGLPLEAQTSVEQPKPTISPALFFSKIALALPQLGSTQEPVLKDILSQLSLKSGDRDDQFLPRVLENMGLSFERKVGQLLAPPNKADMKPVMDALANQDLKAAVLNILSTDGEGAKSEVMKGIANALESFQQLNTHAGESNRFLIPFPIWAQDEFEFGQLLVDTGKKGAGSDENKVVRISFLMNMTQLGAVRADFSILDKSLSGRFLLEDQDTCDYINGLIPALKARLKAIEYQARDIDCRVGEPKVLAPTALIRSMGDSCESGRNCGLDVVV